ncbi:MAG: PAS domain-containing protein [Thermoplasmata archaeon]|nr:MAG: PAS domain-containing protein [Thermoplasmata archaeon]
MRKDAKKGRKKSAPRNAKKRAGKNSKESASPNGSNEIFANARNGMFLMDCQTWDIIDINPSFLKMTGYKPAELVGKKLWEVPDDENGEILKRIFFEIFQKGTSHYDNVPLVTKSQNLLNVELDSTLIDGKDQKSMLCICRNNNSGHNHLPNNFDNKNLTAQHDPAEQFSKELLENANLIVIFINTEGEITLFNREAELFTGKTSEEVAGKKFYEVLTPQRSRDKLKSKFELMINGSDFIESQQYPMHNRHGTERMISWRNTLITNSADDVMGILSIGEDITETKVMERRLKLYSDAIKSSIDSMIITDLNGYIIYNNRAAETVYGYDSSELLGKNYNVLYLDSDPLRNQPLRSLLKDNNSWEGEHLYKRKDGGAKAIYQTMSLIKDESNKSIAILTVGRDITKTKQLEDELRNAKRHSEFYLDILTHDLNDINQGIMGQLQLLGHKVTLEKSHQKHLKAALNQLQSAIRLIDNIKKLSRI